MKIKEGFRMRSILDAHMVVPEGPGMEGYNKMIALNASAAYLWENVEGKDFDVMTLTSLLVDKYDIDQETASRDAAKLLGEWVEAGVIED